MKQDPPAARGAVKGSTDTRSLEWFLSQSSAILREGGECPQHGLERLALRRLWVLIYASPSYRSLRLKLGASIRNGDSGTWDAVQVALDRAAMGPIDLARGAGHHSGESIQ